jgi:hypothetical protein
VSKSNTVLAGGTRDLPARHRLLRAAIESSLEVVPSDSQRLFRWLGAFAGGGQLGDVEVVAAALGTDREWLLTVLTELVVIGPPEEIGDWLGFVADPLRR